MSVGGRLSEQATMDVLSRGNPPLSYGGGRTALTREDVSLRQLEQECLQFFESTIDSLEKSFEEGEEQIQPETPKLANSVFDRPTAAAPAAAATFPSVTPALSSSPAHSSPLQTRTSSTRDHDIIDLVRPEPDLVPRYNATAPDFQNVVAIPSSHLETKPRHEPADLKASEYNPPIPSGSSYRPHNAHSSYCPPGCVPTPVLIAQKIAEDQGGGASNISPSALHPRKSLESDHTVKQGPPTSSKPPRFPANISVIHGSKESNQSLANVNIYERQAQMLANLPGASPYPGQDEAAPHAAAQKGNVPTRSISFRDPTPDKSRMEALSKLGLRNRAQSGGGALYTAPQSATPGATPGATAPHLPRDSEMGARSPVTVQHPSRPAASVIRPDRKQDAVPVNLTSSSSSSSRSVEKSVHVKPSPVEAASRSSYQPVKIERKPSSVSPPEVIGNSYGGKTVVIKPSVSSKGDPLPAPNSLDGKAPAGNIVSRGHSRIISPSLPRNDLPDILSAHIDHSRDLPPPPPPTVEVNNFGGRTRTINPIPAAGGNPNSPARATAKPPAPSTAPKPLRHHVSMNLPRPRATSPEPRRKSTSSKAAAFRPQGITVQFSGKGAMDESRRAALRKLGLMKDTY